MKVTLGFSTCPNDTFIFDAIVNNKIDTEGLEFEVILADVERLNKWAIKQKLDITKISYNAFLHCVSDYVLLDSGSALGSNCGPILLKLPDTKLNKNSKIGIPGKYTTANMLLSIAFPEFNNIVEMLFSDIEDCVIKGIVDGGLIIHENRFTYKNKGLVKVKDLGEFWEQTTNLPIPLGGIVVKRKFSLETQHKINRIIRRSISYAFSNPKSSLNYIRTHAQQMREEVINAHIKLYVNDFSLSLGDKGRRSIETLFNKAGIKNHEIFVNGLN